MYQQSVFVQAFIQLIVCSADENILLQFQGIIIHNLNQNAFKHN